MNKADVRNLSIGSFALLSTGILLPCMTIHPKVGEYTFIAKMLAPKEFESTSYSILDGIITMIQNGSAAIGCLLFLFSVVFPIWKLATFIYYTYRKKDSPSKSLRVALLLGKYSMLDVFVLAVLVIAVKGLPGGSRMDLEVGVYFFTASVLLSILIGHKIKPVELQN